MLETRKARARWVVRGKRRNPALPHLFAVQFDAAAQSRLQEHVEEMTNRMFDEAEIRLVLAFQQLEQYVHVWALARGPLVLLMPRLLSPDELHRWPPSDQ